MVLLINKIYNNFYYYVLLSRFALCNKKGQCNKCVIGKPFGPIFAVQQIIAIKEPDKQKSTYSFVAIDKCVIFYNKIQQVRCFLLDTGVKVAPAEGLINSAY